MKADCRNEGIAFFAKKAFTLYFPKANFLRLAFLMYTAVGISNDIIVGLDRSVIKIWTIIQPEPEMALLM